MTRNLIFIQHQFIPSFSSTTNNSSLNLKLLAPYNQRAPSHHEIRKSLENFFYVSKKFLTLFLSFVYFLQFLAVCLLAGVAVARPNMSYGGSSSSYGGSSNHGGEMKPSANPAMKQQSNYGQYSVTYTAPGQVYTAKVCKST